MKLIHKKSILPLLSLVFLLGSVSTVSANTTATVPLSIGVTGGSLVLDIPDVAVPVSIPAVTIDSIISGNQSPNASFHAFNVSDARGTGAGWNLQLTTQQFSDGSLTLPANRTYLDLTSLTSFAGVSKGSPAKHVLTDGNAFSLLSASAENGMGAFDFADLVIGYDFLKQDERVLKAGSYSSSAYLSAVTGP